MADKLVQQALAAYVDDDFAKAIELYTKVRLCCYMCLAQSTY